MPEEQFGFRVATQCAQVLKNVKLANLITLGTGSWNQICSCLKMSRVICIMVYADGEHEVLYLYRYEQLENHLKREDVREFLSSCGYEIFEIGAVMRRLRLRYQRYAGAEELDDFVTQVESFASGKTIGLFGSYDWGDGEWMCQWVSRMEASEASVVNGGGCIANLEPDETDREQCKALDREMVK